jgi:hypothetical protein
MPRELVTSTLSLFLIALGSSVAGDCRFGSGAMGAAALRFAMLTTS